MKLAQSSGLAPLPSSANPAEPRLSLRGSGGSMATAQSNPASADSELQHSFGPGGVGFDFLPLELPTAATEVPLPTRPGQQLPVLGLESQGPLPELRQQPGVTRQEPGTGSRTPTRFWLDGDVVLCACPDCSAPMSVRFWLMMADCWRCGASIELSEEQERQVQLLLAERDRQQAVLARTGPPLPRPATAPPPHVAPPPATQSPAAPSPAVQPPPIPPSAPRPAAPASERFRGAPPAPQPSRQQPAARRLAAARRAEEPAPVIRREPWLRHLLNETPAWLISMLVHMVMLTVLALLSTEKDEAKGPYILLSASYHKDRTEGGDTFLMKPDDLAQFDLPLPSRANLSNDRERAALLSAAQDARELRLDDDTPNLPDLSTVKGVIGRADGYANAVAARDPRLRVEMVKQEGGTTLTEAAVARGLRWLANHQNEDGSWSLSGFNRAGDCNCSGDGAYYAKAPGTALAMLPFLGAGQTHLAGKYRFTVSKGLRWLIQNQKEDGDLRAGAHGNEGMYTHGQAAIVLCEAFAMTGDEELRVPAQKAINFIVAAQYNDGGWRYTPGPRTLRGDTSVVGWQLMALQSARAANLTVPDETWARADLYLDSVSHRDGALYAYQPRGGATPTMTAEALLCRMYLGWTKEQTGLIRGVEYLSDGHQPARANPNIYYWYYGTQVMHHVGGPQWDDWNVKMRDVLVGSQVGGGHAAGSWDPRGDHAGAGGRIYMTALAVCTLEVYYRHLPIFRQLELAESRKGP